MIFKGYSKTFSTLNNKQYDLCEYIERDNLIGNGIISTNIYNYPIVIIKIIPFMRLIKNYINHFPSNEPIAQYPQQ